MRVVAGIAKGSRLSAPEGMETRPTTDKLKETIFNIIQFDIEGRRVLDLFAGSGQLGIEALSRGAENCVFVDRRQECIKIINENLEHTKLSDAAQVVCSDACDYLNRTGIGKFGIILLDPPYSKGLTEKCLTSIVTLDLLENGGIIICESAVSDSSGELILPYSLKKDYLYKDKKLTLIVKESI